MEGWVKLHRRLLEWEWYSDINVTRLFIHCLLKANHKDNKWRGIDIKRGQFISSYGNLANETHLSVQQIRTCFKKLISTNEITIRTTNKNTIVTIENYSLYQSEEKKQQANEQSNNNQITNEQQSNNNQITTNKNDNNKKNEKKESIELFFSECWKMYPNKKGKGSISDSKKKEVYKLGEEFKRCIERYKTEIKENVTDIKYVKQGSTFFNSGYVDYLDENTEDVTKIDISKLTKEEKLERLRSLK